METTEQGAVRGEAGGVRELNRLRVVHVVISLAAGGLERLVVDWTNARNRRAPRSTEVCCLDEPGDLAELVEGDAVRVLGARRSRVPFDVPAAAALRRLLARGTAGGADIVHSHNLAAQQYAALATLGTRVRHLHTEHGSNVHTAGLRNRLRLAFVRRFTDRVVAVSEHTARALRESGVVRGDVDVIPNGVTPHPRFPAQDVAALRTELAISGRHFVIGSVGRLAREKGYDRLLSAFARVAAAPAPEDSRPPVLLLVGEGPDRPALERQTKDLGLHDRVVFAGYRRDARRFYDLMDLFVLPSRSEGLPVALLEAMAAGVPVMVADAGECRRVIGEGQFGMLLPADEAEWPSLLLRGMRLRATADWRERCDLSRRHVAEHYSRDRTLDQYEKLYTGLCRSLHDS